jgi:hypothetical protein
MATAAQIKANIENAKHSTGAKTEAGREASSRNNRRHGLAGHAFFFLEWENPDHFEQLLEAFESEHQPKTPTECLLVEKMAQHYWLSQRAQEMQTSEMQLDPFDDEILKRVTVYMRYQTQQERLFKSALADLLKLRAERRKEQIGFESQKRAQEKHERTIAVLDARVARSKPAPKSVEAPVQPAKTVATTNEPIDSVGQIDRTEALAA